MNKSLLTVLFLLTIIALSPSILSDSVFAQVAVATPENPIPVSSIAANADLPFQSAHDVTTVKIGSSTYALVASNGNDVSIISGVQIIDITDPTSPTSVSSITDATATNGSAFDALVGAYSITTVKIGSSTYALVASIDDVPGIQIIDISNPANPTAVTSIADDTTDGSGGTFDTLTRPFDVTTVKIGSVTYALVADSRGDGVQIIDISNPAAPTAVSSVIDATSSNGSTFDTLEGVEAITTVTIGSDVYALVASFEDTGIQIINITNPASPTAASSVTTGFGAFDVTTVTIGSSTYALVASSSAIQIINITDPTNPSVVTSISNSDRDSNNSMFRFDEANDITTVTIGSSTYALVTSGFIDNLQIINITDPENPLLASLIVDDDTLSLDEPRGITTVQIGSSLYAVIASDGDARTQIIRIAEDQPVIATPANPIAVSAVTDGSGGFTTLGTVGDIATVTIGSSTYALVASLQDDQGGIQIIDITNPASPTAASAITTASSGGAARLDGATSIATVKIGSATYALVASVFDNTVQILDITNPTNPTPVFTIRDGNTFDTINGANSITTVKMGQSTYALVASNGDHGVQIIDITNPLAPTAVASVRDGVDGFDELDGASGITTVQIGSSTYALVTAFRDNGIQIIDITDIENPIAASSISGGVGGFNSLSEVGDITTVKIGSTTYALVLSGPGDYVQIINISDPTNPTPAFSLNHDSTDSAGGTFDILDFPTDIATVVIDGSTYAIVTGNIDDGIQIVDMSNPVAPTAVSSVANGDVDAVGTTFIRLNGPVTITTVQIDSSIYVLVASNQGSPGVQIIRIAEDQPDPKPIELEPATPENPVAVSSITDDSSFTLDGSNDITTVQIGSSTYALVTANDADTVQIIDITNPANPIAVSSVTDGGVDGNNNSFDTLDGILDITTVKIGSSTYALVTSFTDKGIQIIDITNPAAPTAVSSVSDGSTFNTLNGANSITTVVIDQSTYALVTAIFDRGVQIIDITNPAAPTAVSSITDGSTFDVLDGANRITTVTIGSSTYALVTATSDRGVQIIDITNPAAPTAVSSIRDGSTFDELDNPSGITTVTIGSSTYALVAATFDDGVQIINITNPAAPTAVSSISDGDTDGNGNTFDELDNASDITTVTIGSSTYALVASSSDDGIQIINITDPAAPTAASSISDGDVDGNGDIFDELDGTFNITTVQIDSSIYALAAASNDDGVQIIRIAESQPEPEPEPEPEPASPTNPIAVSALTDNRGGFNVLSTPRDITTVKIGLFTYAIVSSFVDDQGGIQIINMTNPAAPTVASAITTAGSGGAARLDGAEGMTTVKIGSDTYVLVTAVTDDAVQILNISNPANPTPVFTIRDGNTFDTLDGANDIATIKIGSATYALVTSNRDHGIQIINITNPAAPTAVTSIVDGGTDSASNTFDELRGASSITTVQIGSSVYALVAAFSDNGVQIIDITDPADPLAVSSVNSNSNGFGNLTEVNDITTIKIGSATYALVLSGPTDHVQIINISDPTTPTPASSIIHDGVDSDGGTFDILDFPTDVTTVTIGDSTYAIVLGNIDDGIQIINISNPTMPIAVSSVANGDADAVGTTFTRLDGPSTLTTVQIDSSLYLLVASSQGSPGVQIIRIAEDSPEPEPEPVATFENPVAVSSVTDGGTFDTLAGANAITTVTIGSSTYALVAASSDDGIQIIDITDPAVPTAASSVSDGATFDTLDNAFDITTVTIGSSTYTLVVANDDDGIQIIDITNPAAPTAASSVSDGDTDGNGDTFDTLNGANAITTVTIGSSTYALVTASIDNGIQIIDITDPTNPTAVSSITDGDTFDTLDGANGIAVVRIGSSTYALVTASRDQGIQIIDITDPTNPTAVSSISDGDTDGSGGTFDTLNGARGITTAKIGSAVYALAAAKLDNGIQIIDITDPATPTAVSSITDGDADGSGGTFDELDGARNITTVKIGSATYALTAANGDNGIQIINITNPAAPTAAYSLSDGVAFDELEGARDITTVQIGSATYALAAASADNGVQIIRIAESRSDSSSDGSSSTWKKKPTFGKSWEVSSDQLVKNGFTFNGYTLDITDNWHTDFVKTSTIIGEINHVQMRVFAFDGLWYVQLSLGLPEIGAISDAETDIIVNLERNYDNPNGYDIVGIEHEQTEALVNTDSTTASITPSLCNNSHTELRCYDIDIEFVVDAPLSHDVLAISAIDTKRRATITHINEGIEFLGEPILPAETASIFIKKTNQGKGNHMILTQDDRRYNTWTDQDGYLWTQNSYGTWTQQTMPDMIISHDGTTQVMTRLHSEFDSMVQQEQERAILVFDSKSIQSVPGEPFSYEFNEIIPRHLDESLLERMELEEILALEKMINIYIYDANWSEIDDDDNSDE